MNFSVCIHVLFIVKGCNFNIKTLKPSMTEKVFFFLLVVTVLDLNKIMKFLKSGEYYRQKKRTLIENMLVGKNTDYIFLVYRLKK